MKKGILILAGLLMFNGMAVHASEPEGQNIIASTELVHQHDNDKCYVNTYHIHSGNAQTYGSCYTNKIVTGDTIVNTWEDDQCCSNCQEGPEAHYDGNPYGACSNFNSTWTEEVEDYYYELTCNKTTDTLESSYMSCTVNETDICAIGFAKDVSGEYKIKPIITKQAEWITDITFTWNNGALEDCPVSANGLYSCKIKYKDLAADMEKESSIQILVSDYPEDDSEDDSDDEPEDEVIEQLPAEVIEQPVEIPLVTESFDNNGKVLQETSKPGYESEGGETENMEQTQVEEEIPQVPVTPPDFQNEIPNEVGADAEDEVEIKGWTMAQTIAATAAGAATTSGGIFVFVFFWIFRKCRIYDDLTGKLLGKAYVYKRKKTFETTISRSICRKVSSKIYIRFNPNFVKANADKAFVVRANGKEIVKNIQQDIYIKI